MAFLPLMIISSNVNSIKTPEATFQVYQSLGQLQADIFFVQVTRLTTTADIKKASREWCWGPTLFSIAAEPSLYWRSLLISPSAEVYNFIFLGFLILFWVREEVSVGSDFQRHERRVLD
ncbi:hypothetical protein XELAEV_18024629mg [Xenopus laevis]|uniref:Uncharacterized protein n=1 Tax=Xenopus laevis TaxID=8355 RepID=A0A974D0E6_XENLA|nr:hypothetical protein XELAEV_18024629mg [Xenopus laevis]